MFNHEVLFHTASYYISWQVNVNNTAAPTNPVGFGIVQNNSLGSKTYAVWNSSGVGLTNGSALVVFEAGDTFTLKYRN